MATNSLTRCVLAQGIFLYAALAHSAAEPSAAVADCRAKYAESPSEHVACLERALNALGGKRQESAPASLGHEQLKKKTPQESVERATVQIANVTYGFDGRGLFRMTDGQVWKATESA
ncbi:hypothetical protein, partial [Steroidobacter sp.]|uniref:hypothetical protein n=1 Tax=Steroidobacter sp. TaxID=1978227 RepID=UPI001A4AAD41